MSSATTQQLPALKLTYFDFKGRAEPIRLALQIAGISFQDHRFASAEWKTLKPSTPFGQVPVISVDGKVVSQTVPILRYVGKLKPDVGLYPTDPFLALKVDELMNVVDEMDGIMVPTMYVKDETEKARQRAAIMDTTSRFMDLLSRFDRSLSEHPGYCVGNVTTVLDLHLYTWASWIIGGTLDGVPTTLLSEGFPATATIVKRVGEMKQVREWEEAHPDKE
ncbi:cytochrome c oxidase subunit 1 [Thoreauomyces humboldtii]|nr:cytochrome c oxidase subunit 1 [Thoreauomyces humboldtii]